MKTGEVVDDRYTVIAELGAGGTGTVYKAREIGLERIVALKMLQPSLFTEKGSLQRFEREGKILSTLSHRNLPRFYRFGLWKEQYPYIAMEYIAGVSLSTVLDKNGPLKIDNAISIAVQICRGVFAAHSAGIVHRDLKPSNIMLVTHRAQEMATDFEANEVPGEKPTAAPSSKMASTAPSLQYEPTDKNVDQSSEASPSTTAESNQLQFIDAMELPTKYPGLERANLDLIRIVDFGLAAFLTTNNASSQVLTYTGELIGTIQYMSPEQCKGQQVDHRTDIYALGCILYECLTGTPPFSGTNPISIMQQHVSQPVPILPRRLRGQHTPAGLIEILQKTLEKESSNRYDSMAQLEKDLRCVSENRGEEALAMQHPVVPVKQPQWHRLTMALLSVAVIAFVFCIGLSGQRGPLLPANDRHSHLSSKFPTPTTALRRAFSATRRYHTLPENEQEQALAEAIELATESLTRIPDSDAPMLFQAHLTLHALQQTLYMYWSQADRKEHQAHLVLVRAQEHAAKALTWARDPGGGYFRPACAAFEALGETAQEAGDLQKSQQYFETALKLFSSTPPSSKFVVDSELPGRLASGEDLFVRWQLAQCLISQGKTREAENQLKEAITKANENTKTTTLDHYAMECKDFLFNILSKQNRLVEIAEMRRSTESDLVRGCKIGVVSNDTAGTYYAMLAKWALAEDLDESVRLTQLAVEHLDADMVWLTAWKVSQAVEQLEKVAESRGRKDVLIELSEINKRLAYLRGRQR